MAISAASTRRFWCCKRTNRYTLWFLCQCTVRRQTWWAPPFPDGKLRWNWIVELVAGKRIHWWLQSCPPWPPAIGWYQLYLPVKFIIRLVNIMLWLLHFFVRTSPSFSSIFFCRAACFLSVFMAVFSAPLPFFLFLSFLPMSSVLFQLKNLNQQTFFAARVAFINKRRGRAVF